MDLSGKKFGAKRTARRCLKYFRGNNDGWISENCQWQLKGKAHLREFVKN